MNSSIPLIMAFMTLASSNIAYVPSENLKVEDRFSAEVSLSEDEIDYIHNLLKSDEWKNTLGNCMTDYTISFGNQVMNYHTDCGTINDIKNMRSLTLSDKDKEKLNLILSDSENGFEIIMKTSEITPSGIYLSVTSSRKDNIEMYTGSYYWIEKLNGDSWEKVPTVYPEDQIGWTDELYIISSDHTVERSLGWTHLYRNLEKGVYRIGIEVSGENRYKEYETVDCYGYFEIR